MNKTNLVDLSNCLRFLSIAMVEKANSGHPGLPMGMADVATILFKNHIRFFAKDPKWDYRDRFILSGGHGSALLYSLLYLTGYEHPTLDDLKSFRTIDSPCAGHPEYAHLDGIETTTGPLGQGFANAVGIAIAQKKIFNQSQLSADGSNVHKFDESNVYVMAGDGDLMEGISHEAGALAGHLKLNNLIVLFDDNGITIDGPTSLSTSEDPVIRFKNYGFDTMRIDGHDFNAIDDALRKARESDKPVIIACKTIIGKGAPNKAGSSGVHGSPLGNDEYKKTKKALNWPYEDFEIPAYFLKEWREFGKKHEGYYYQTSRTSDVNIYQRIRIQKTQIENLKIKFHKTKENQATRVLFQNVLNEYAPHMPHLIGGSADLTPSNNTKATTHHVITADDFSGNYIHYGIREHAMAAIMNGLALSGFIPYGGTFLVFSDYMRPAMRLSAMMKQQVFYVLTHDSIGLGEDGPTHQPIEHISSMRAIPNLLVFRPSDAAEMLECWQTALENKDKPSVFALSRQKNPYLRAQHSTKNLCEKGAYVIRHAHKEEEEADDITIIGTGSEVYLCIVAQEHLMKKGIHARIVSMPCMDLFLKLSKEEQRDIVGDPKAIIAVEAGLGMSFDQIFNKWACPSSFIGMKSYGASGKDKELYKFFGITSENIINTTLSLLGR